MPATFRWLIVNARTPRLKHRFLLSWLAGLNPLRTVIASQLFFLISQSERPRPLLFYVDCRHYMPGAERLHATNWMGDNERPWDKIVPGVGMGHLDQLEYVEEGNAHRRSGLEERPRLHAANNDLI